MTYKYQILLGRISRVNGYDGSLIIKLEKSFFDNVPEMESVFLEISGKPVPFFISSSEYQGGDSLKLKLEGYTVYEKASEFAGCRIFLTTVNEKAQPENKPENINGFKVILQNRNLIGTVKEIIQNPGNDLIKLISPEKKEILVPFHTDFIKGFDIRKRTITVELPEGLIDLN
jgi:16S rRNA processing protein RimM